MLLRQQLRPSTGLQHCPSIAAAGALSACRRCRTASSRKAAVRLLTPPAATAAAADTAPAGKKPRKHTSRKKDAEQQPVEPPEPDLPMPLDYQQTLIKSFTIGGVGLHSGKYAWIRVRPAFAGEGRYFVRVPEGTNKNRFAFDDGNLKEQASLDEATQEEPIDEDLEDTKVEWFSLYLVAQEERGFEGAFRDFLDVQVKLGEMTEELRRRILGMTDDDFHDEELPPGMGVEPDMNFEPEEIVPLDPEDPTVVTATITSVTDIDLPFTQLADGDKRVMNVELLLSALEACGVDNARIEVEGGHEIPVLDNSSLGWCVEVQCAGMRPAPLPFAEEGTPEGSLAVARRDVIAPSKAIAVQDDEGWIAFFPGPFANLTAGVDHTRVAPVIGSQWFTWHSDDTHYRYSLAPARAYAESVQQLYAMREAGFVKAGAENLFIIANGDAWWDPDMVRMVYDEPVRYRLVQLIGNLSLLNVAGCQGIPVGHVTAFNPTPSLQLAFVRAVLESIEADDVVSMNVVMQAQENWIVDRSATPRHYLSISQGPSDLGDGTPATVQAELMGDYEEA